MPLDGPESHGDKIRGKCGTTTLPLVCSSFWQVGAFMDTDLERPNAKNRSVRFSAQNRSV